MGSELPTKVGEGVEGVGIVEAFLVFSVAAFDLAVMAGRVRANQLVPDTHADSSSLKNGLEITVTVGEAIGELEAVVSLDTLDVDTLPGYSILPRKEPRT